MKQSCKHNKPKGYCEKCFTEKWSDVCQVCGIRKGIFSTSVGSEGGRDSICKCEK